MSATQPQQGQAGGAVSPAQETNVHQTIGVSVVLCLAASIIEFGSAADG